MEKMTLATAIKKFLSLETEKAVDIIKNVKELTPKDREDLKQYFLEIGIEIVPPQQ